MIKPIISKINTSLKSVDEIAVVYDYGVSKIEKYPAIVWTPIGFDNEYLTNEENLIGYTFRLMILVETRNVDKRNGLIDILIPAYDAVMKKLAEDWNYGADDDGNRIWSRATGGAFNIEDTQNGKIWTAEINLTVNQSIDI